MLWESRLATTVQGFPMTYEVDGVQYLVYLSRSNRRKPLADQ